MTTVETTPPPPITPAPPQRKRTRTLPIAVGTTLAVIGSVFALGGAGTLAIAGDDGTIGSGDNQTISTPTSALVTDTATIEDTRDIASVVGQPEIGLNADATDKDVFVGIGPADEVDRYLQGVATDRVTDVDLDPFELDKDRHEGSRTAAPPTSQSFWVAQDSGQRADLDWKVKDGDYRAVVMNADGSPSVTTESHFEVGLPYLSSIGLSVLLAGVISVGAGIVLITRSLNS